MANIYVRSTDGNNADSGATWALAKLDLVGAAGIDANGDTIYVSHNHAESTAGAITPSFAGTNASPVRIVCGNDGAEPPTAVATTATVTTTGTAAINLSNGVVSCYGITFNAGTGAGNASITVGNANSRSVWEKCNFKILATGISSVISVSRPLTAINCGFRFGAADQSITIGSGAQIIGGSVLSGGTSPTILFNGTVGDGTVTGFDLSNCSAGINLAGTSVSGVLVLRDCKLPSSWSGSLTSGTITGIGSATLINCAAGAVNYAYWRSTFCGDIKHETTVIRTGGASDGTTPISHKMISNSNVVYPTNALVSQDIYKKITPVAGSPETPVTATVEIMSDFALNDNEIYLDVVYLGSTTSPLGTRITDDKANPLAAASSQDSSSAAWPAMGSPGVAQKLSVTFTPQMEGYLIAKVVLTKASKTVYVDPLITLT